MLKYRQFSIQNHSNIGMCYLNMIYWLLFIDAKYTRNTKYILMDTQKGIIRLTRICLPYKKKTAMIISFKC